jgi:hypothetical protein
LGMSSFRTGEKININRKVLEANSGPRHHIYSLGP